MDWFVTLQTRERRREEVVMLMMEQKGVGLTEQLSRSFKLGLDHCTHTQEMHKQQNLQNLHIFLLMYDSRHHSNYIQQNTAHNLCIR